MGDVNLVKADGTTRTIATDLNPAVGVSLEEEGSTRYIPLTADVALHNSKSATVSVYFGALVRRT